MSTSINAIENPVASYDANVGPARQKRMMAYAGVVTTGFTAVTLTFIAKAFVIGVGTVAAAFGGAGIAVLIGLIAFAIFSAIKCAKDIKAEETQNKKMKRRVEDVVNTAQAQQVAAANNTLWSRLTSSSESSAE